MKTVGYTMTTGNITGFHGVLAREFSGSNKNNIYGSNPCKNCPNFEFEDAEDGTYAYCILGGGENCDRGDDE